MKHTITHKIKKVILEFDEDEVNALIDLCDIADAWFSIYAVAGYSNDKKDAAHYLVKEINAKLGKTE